MAQSPKSFGSSATHQTLQKSSTLNRRYVHRPTTLTTPKKSLSIPISDTAPKNLSSKTTISSFSMAQAESLRRRQAIADQMNHQAALRRKKATELKNQAISAALKNAPLPNPTPSSKSTATIHLTTQPLPSTPHPSAPAPKPSDFTSTQSSTPNLSSTLDSSLAKAVKKTGRGKKFLMALTCSITCVAVLGYLLYLNLPDLSVKVAALRTGIEASYPTYLPRSFQLGSVSTTQENNVLIDFTGPDGKTFTLSEENSSWDSSTLLSNYVKPTWREDFVTIREQGITIYIYQSNAAWVNGGILYKLNSNYADTLTKRQITDLATSL